MSDAKKIGRDLKLVTAAEMFAESPGVCTWYSRWPNIYRFMLQQWKDSETEPLPTITTFASGSKVRVCLCDRRQWRSIFRSGSNQAEALAAISEALGRPNVDWRDAAVRRGHRRRS